MILQPQRSLPFFQSPVLSINPSFYEFLSHVCHVCHLISQCLMASTLKINLASYPLILGYHYPFRIELRDNYGLILDVIP